MYEIMKIALSKITMNRGVSCLFLGAVFMSIFSCCNNPIEDVKKRNILFYIGAGEYVINDDAPAKINQMRLGWQPGYGEMIIYFDKYGEGAYLFRINETKDARGYYGLDTIQGPVKENSADSKVLSRVINKFVIDYQADSYGMIFFSHASGWLPEGTLSSPRSLVIDNDRDSGNREMEYYDFAAAIPDKQFDFIIFEACLMADVMSMYELRNKADYILASAAEIVRPGFAETNTYRDEIMNLYDTKSDVKYILSGFARSYYDGIISKYPENHVDCSATLSVVKMDEMENLASVTRAIFKGKSFDEADLLVDIDSIQTYDRSSHSTFGRQRYCRYFDFTHAVERLVFDADYKPFYDQMDKTVVWKASTKRFLLGDYISGAPYYSEYYGFFIKRHSGLTTYIKQIALPETNSAYEKSSWYKAIN